MRLREERYLKRLMQNMQKPLSQLHAQSSVPRQNTYSPPDAVKQTSSAIKPPPAPPKASPHIIPPLGTAAPPQSTAAHPHVTTDPYKQVFMFGDSQSNGVHPKLPQEYIVHNITRSGATLAQLTQLVPHALSPSASHVVLMGGTNNETMNPESFNDAYQDLIRAVTAHCPHAKITCCGLFDRKDVHMTDHIQTLNATILASSCQFINNVENAESYDIHSGDGLHLNPTGKVSLSKAVATAILRPGLEVIKTFKQQPGKSAPPHAPSQPTNHQPKEPAWQKPRRPARSSHRSHVRTAPLTSVPPDWFVKPTVQNTNFDQANNQQTTTLPSNRPLSQPPRKNTPQQHRYFGHSQLRPRQQTRQQTRSEPAHRDAATYDDPPPPQPAPPQQSSPSSVPAQSLPPTPSSNYSVPPPVAQHSPSPPAYQSVFPPTSPPVLQPQWHPLPANCPTWVPPPPPPLLTRPFPSYMAYPPPPAYPSYPPYRGYPPMY